MALDPPLHQSHQLPSGSHRHLTPLEALLTRHQGRVRSTHPIKHIPRSKGSVSSFSTKDAYRSYLKKEISNVIKLSPTDILTLGIEGGDLAPSNESVGGPYK